MSTGQLFSRTTQALFYNYKQLPIERMLDFDLHCERETPSVAGIITPGAEGFQKLFFGKEEIVIPVHSTYGKFFWLRALVLPRTEDIDSWLKFASLYRKNNRISQARSTLVKLLQYDPETSSENVRYNGPPQVMLAYLKFQWSLGEDHKRKE